MPDRKQVRRRRAVFGVLLVTSLLLLTAYFGESAGGPFHSVQRGVLTVLTPIQDGASKALKPVRDLVGWFGDTFDAKSERDKLRRENQRLTKLVVGADAARSENRQLRGLVNLDNRGEVSSARPVTARVIVRSPTLWYSTIEVDRGSADGVRVDQPVLGGTSEVAVGLVGRISEVTANSAVVTLVTDHTSGVAAKVLDARGDPGIVVPEVGNPGKLLIQTLPPRSPVRAGNAVVTSGTSDSRLRSLFPPNIPIGTISASAPGELALTQQAHLDPVADLRRLDFVQILTRPDTNAVTASIAP